MQTIDIWDNDAAYHIAWLIEHQDDLPEFFRLGPGRRVVCKECFLRSLWLDIHRGPRCPRGRNGALQEILSVLYERFGGDDRQELLGAMTSAQAFFPTYQTTAA